MRVLVTGASGFLGSLVARRLVAAGHAVRALLRSTSDPVRLRGLAVERRSGSLAPPVGLDEALEGVDAVVHCAGGGRASKTRSFYVDNTDSTVALLDAEAEGLTHEQTAAKAAQLDAALTLFVVYGQQPSASTQCMPGARKSATAFRALSDRPVAMMGTHCAALPERTLREEPVDFVFTGEGPATLDALLAHLVHGKGGLDAVPGLVRWQDGDVVTIAANGQPLTTVVEQPGWLAATLSPSFVKQGANVIAVNYEQGESESLTITSVELTVQYHQPIGSSR